MTNKTTKNAPFIPTEAQWAGLYAKWSEKLAKSLWAFGNAHECREAVHEAFLKAMGLSDHLQLHDELTPKVEGCWYGFLRNQAKGILSNYHRRSGRFEPLKEYGLTEEDDEPAAEADFEASDRAELREKVRQTVADVCRRAGVNEGHLHAFALFVLGEADGSDVVRTVPELLNTNNLYQVKNRIMKLLGKFSDRFETMHDELLAA